MLTRIRNSITKLLCSESDSLAHRNQVARESVHGQNLVAKWASCDACVEENKVCKCHHDICDQDLKVLNGPAEADCSFAHAVINMTGMLIGLGQLSTPYALEKGGWTSSFLLMGLGVMSAYTSHLLGKCLDKNPKSRSYTDVAQHAFGTHGRLLTSAFVCLEIFMTLVSYTISLHDNIITVFPRTQLSLPWANLSASQLLTTMAVLIAVPSLWLKDLSSISFLSTGGVLMSIVIFTCVACTAIFGFAKADRSIPTLQLQNIPSISGLYIFSYAGHIVFPNLHKSMKDPSKFTKVSIVSFASVTTLYTLLAFMGAKMFGPEVSSQITLSMPRHLVITKIALWATVLTPMTKYALEFAPFAIQLERSLPGSMSSRTKMIIRGTVGSVLLLIILVLALSVPYFEHVLSLTGSLVSISICVLLPCAFYTKICWAKISKPAIVLNLTLVAIGCLVGAIGTISSSKLLVRSLKGAHSM